MFQGSEKAGKDLISYSLLFKIQTTSQLEFTFMLLDDSCYFCDNLQMNSCQ